MTSMTTTSSRIESLIYCGHLKEYMGGDANASSSQQHHTLAGVIDIIIRRTTSDGASTSTRKAYAKQLSIQGSTPKKLKPDDVMSFSDNDLKGVLVPHDDALVVSMIIANQMAKRILVGNGSSVDILFYDTFEKMKLTLDWLQQVNVPLVGFSGDVIKPEGRITLLVTIGTEPRQVTRMIEFFVVKIGSLYNAITRRLTLDALKAAISSYHLTMKFPTKHGVGVARRTSKKPENVMWQHLRVRINKLYHWKGLAPGMN
ncbi:PREDICTED: uncharacterized protein LOC104606339 isoform X2 [Nelumbo nucifera]|uniref:Uncharacterized protein LOC104606339 isoform X2 n=1 Tax=Nelumbo nucifera TaxID=4432 RepID=A0A1U8APQ4_NELNU|nr:PREDICTED: uncharacterized protein LOC104606339 isoform X2 [Nelumbo nucifera]